jgi:chemotaxis regulatin CheY-phosphate phosphatase CheZ
MWKTLFEPEIGDDHMRTLVEHVDAFFSDIITETEQRTVTIRKRIDGKI